MVSEVSRLSPTGIGCSSHTNLMKMKRQRMDGCLNGCVQGPSVDFSFGFMSLTWDLIDFVYTLVLTRWQHSFGLVFNYGTCLLFAFHTQKVCGSI